MTGMMDAARLHAVGPAMQQSAMRASAVLTKAAQHVAKPSSIAPIIPVM